MSKKFLISWVVAFVVWMIGSFTVYGAWLAEPFAALTNIMRPEEEQTKLVWLMLLSHVVLAGAFVWIYQRGVEAKPWVQQGIRFGIAVAFLTAIPMSAIYYVVQQMPGMLSVKQAIGDTVVLLVVALVTAFMNRESAET